MILLGLTALAALLGSYHGGLQRKNSCIEFMTICDSWSDGRIFLKPDLGRDGDHTTTKGGIIRPLAVVYLMPSHW
jgi:hypothetical protein